MEAWQVVTFSARSSKVARFIISFAAATALPIPKSTTTAVAVAAAAAACINQSKPLGEAETEREKCSFFRSFVRPKRPTRCSCNLAPGAEAMACSLRLQAWTNIDQPRHRVSRPASQRYLSSSGGERESKHRVGRKVESANRLHLGKLDERCSRRGKPNRNLYKRQS